MANSAKRHAILILDDELPVLKALVRLLRDEDYDAHTASNYEDAMTLLGQRTFAVVIADYRMPDVSGDDFLEFVEGKYPLTARVMLSGTAFSGSVPQTIANDILHCQTFLAKPWNDEELKRVIRESIARYEASEESLSSSEPPDYSRTGAA